jgi:hypothetical protein
LNTSSHRIIEIIVSPAGETAVQTKGFTGSACRDASRQIERALGTVQSDQPTAEMYQSQAVADVIRQGNG